MINIEDVDTVTEFVPGDQTDAVTTLSHDGVVRAVGFHRKCRVGYDKRKDMSA